MQQKLEKAFLAKVFIFFQKFRHSKRINYGILFNQLMLLIFLCQLKPSVSGKFSETISKSILNQPKFENQRIKIGC